MTALELSTLWAIVLGVDWNTTMLDQFVCLLDENRGEVRVERLPAAFVGILAEMSEEQMARGGGLDADRRASGMARAGRKGGRRRVRHSCETRNPRRQERVPVDCV